MDSAQETASPTSNPGWSRAAGKVILFGEHAVVYGVRAISAGISKGVLAQASSAEVDSVQVNGVELPADHELLTALGALRVNLGTRPIALKLNSELPRGAGLGSSAAMAVATIRAIAQTRHLDLSEHAVFEAAQSWERVFHGNPSGVDVASAQSSSLIGFSRGARPESLTLAKKLHLVVAQAGPPASTKHMVEQVAKHKVRSPEQFEKTLLAISSLVDNAQLLLRQGQFEAVGKLMDFNHMLLAGWMLSTEDIETACKLAREAGALGAKLTGAGGGGCIVALAPDSTQQISIERTLKTHNIPAFSATVGEDI